MFKKGKFCLVKLDNPDVREVTILDICGPPTLLSTKALK
jgi:hypothetical protein